MGSLFHLVPQRSSSHLFSSAVGRASEHLSRCKVHPGALHDSGWELLSVLSLLQLAMGFFNVKFGELSIAQHCSALLSCCPSSTANRLPFQRGSCRHEPSHVMVSSPTLQPWRCRCKINRYFHSFSTLSTVTHHNHSPKATICQEALRLSSQDELTMKSSWNSSWSSLSSSAFPKHC